jgi:hypothetical protein
MQFINPLNSLTSIVEVFPEIDRRMLLRFELEPSEFDDWSFNTCGDMNIAW